MAPQQAFLGIEHSDDGAQCFLVARTIGVSPEKQTIDQYPRHSMYVIYAYIDPSNHPNVGIYGSPMECLGIGCQAKKWEEDLVVSQDVHLPHQVLPMFACINVQSKGASTANGSSLCFRTRLLLTSFDSCCACQCV